MRLGPSLLISSHKASGHSHGAKISRCKKPGGERDPHLGPEQVSGSYMQVSPASDFTAEELDDIYDDIGDVSIAASGVAKASRAWKSQAL